MSKCLFQGHGSLRFITDESVVIYVDPFCGSGYEIPADLILVTHEHYDHNKIDLVMKKEDCIIIRENTLKTGHVYQKTSIKGIEIEAVEAYNEKHDITCCVGYVLRFDGFTIYCAGDTSLTNDMQEKLPNYHIDYAFLPIDGIYNMDAVEAMHCADVIKAKRVVPIHMKPLEPFDFECAEKFKHSNRLIIKSGEEISL